MHVLQRPRLLSDNGSCFIAAELRRYLDEHKRQHIRTKSYHLMTQGKIERYFRSMKNLILLDVYYSPEELTERIGEWVDYYNNHRYHDAIHNVTSSDRYFGREQEILERRKKIKTKTVKNRREWYRRTVIQNLNIGPN